MSYATRQREIVLGFLRGMLARQEAQRTPDELDIILTGAVAAAVAAATVDEVADRLERLAGEFRALAALHPVSSG